MLEKLNIVYNLRHFEKFQVNLHRNMSFGKFRRGPVKKVTLYVFINGTTHYKCRVQHVQCRDNWLCCPPDLTAYGPSLPIASHCSGPAILIEESTQLLATLYWSTISMDWSTNYILKYYDGSFFSAFKKNYFCVTKNLC